LDRSDAERIIRALETFAAAGYGDVKALKGALKGRYRLRVGKCASFSVLNNPIPWLSPKSTTAAKPTDASNPGFVASGPT
jgi:hypothetical protein